MKKKSKLVYLSESYLGQKKFPEWYTEFKHKDFFDWSYTQEDVTEHYRCDLSGYTGTLYNCHSRKIGKNYLVTFKLESVLYHCPATEKLYELEVLDKRLSLLHETIVNDINNMSISGSDSESQSIKFSQLINLADDISIKLTKVKRKILKTQKRPTDTSGNILVLKIKMIPHKTLDQKLLLEILEMVNVDDDDNIANYLSNVTLTKEELGVYKKCLTYYIPLRVQWQKPKRQFDIIKIEKFELKKPRVKDIKELMMPGSIVVCETCQLRAAKQVLVRREAIDDYKVKLEVEAEGIFYPLQFYWATDLEIEIAKHEYRVG